MMDSEQFARYFGLRERPFTLLPDPDFLFWTDVHRRAFSVLEYGLMTRAPITVITGEVGAGKTTLVQKLLGSIDSSHVVGLISNAQGNRGELMQWVLAALEVPCDMSAPYVEKFQLLLQFVISCYADNKRVVLIIDEAQNLSIEGLEELRMLTNVNANKDELIQLILVGQPELRQMISRPSLRQFAQRVTATFHVPAMDRETTGDYILHRLQHAGGTGEEFGSDAVDVIFANSGGVPRLVNKLCDFCMVYAYANDERTIAAPIVDEVLADGIYLSALELTDAAE